MKMPIGYNLVEDHDSAPKFTPGTYVQEPDGRVYQYLKNEGGTAAGKWARIDENLDATSITTTNASDVSADVGIACRAMTDEYYGWYFRGCGVFEAIIANSFTAGDQLFTSATGGVPGANGGSDIGIDGATAIDAGVTNTRVTIRAAGLLSVGKAAAAD